MKRSLPTRNLWSGVKDIFVLVVVGRWLTHLVASLLWDDVGKGGFPTAQIDFSSPQDPTTLSQSLEMKVILKNQISLQEEFQALLLAQQYPPNCSESRILINAQLGPLDGFTLEFRMMARFLHTALATNRTLVLPNGFKSAYASPDCRQVDNRLLESVNDWECLHEPFTNCTEDTASAFGEDILPATIDAAVGIIDHDSVGHYFSPKFYGEQRLIYESSHNIVGGGNIDTPYADVIEHWERAMGRFWVRAQCSHALWKPSMWLRNEIKSRLPKSLFQPPVKYIGMHLRFSDNVIDFEKDFSRLANITRDFNNFLSKANNIRKDTGITRIYLATDYAAIVETLSNKEKDGFTFSFQPDAPRTYTKDHLWFNTSRKTSAAAIATDVEVLRRADYLIGSFQSNVYRLATELNTAYNAGKYPITMKRHLTVDLEWYEDP